MGLPKLDGRRDGVARQGFSLAPFFLAVCLTCAAALSAARLPLQAQMPAATKAPAAPVTAGEPFTAAQISAMLPDAVYFQGKTAPLQLRNAGGASLKGAIVWVALVDSSGYSSGVQERYQFYLVTEGPLRFGDAMLSAGAYGGGFVGDRFVVMDIGGHTVAEGPVKLDPGLRRPRPLEVLPDSATAVKLYLGRRWVLLHAGK